MDKIEEQALRLSNARHVLWFFGDLVLGLQPGSFTTHLLRAISAADAWNRMRLAQGFPELVEMVVSVQETEQGLEDLRGLVKAGVQ